jgi:hypothetical protein
VKEMGIRVTACKVEVKVVNSKEKAIARVTSLVHIQLDKRKCQVDFIVFPMK